MRSNRNVQRKGRPMAGRLALVAAVVAAMSACSAAKETKHLPGLSQVRVTGPQGQVCYDKCSIRNGDCASMCPTGSADCTDECMAHAKTCLQGCPEVVPLVVQ